MYIHVIENRHTTVSLSVSYNDAHVIYIFLTLIYIFQMWYQFAKVSAEEAATKFLTENDIDYVVMNPAVTIGPLLQPELNGSSSLIFDLIKGNFYLLIKCSFCV